MQIKITNTPVQVSENASSRDIIRTKPPAPHGEGILPFH